MTFFITDTGINMMISSNNHAIRDFIVDNRKMLKNYSNKNGIGETIYCSMIALFEVMTKITEYFEADGWQVDFKVR